MVGSIGGNKFLSQFIVGLAPEQNEITVEVKGMVRAKVNSDVNFASRNLFPSLHPTLANRGTHAANQSSKNFPKPTYSWTSRPNVPGWLMRAADQTKTKNTNMGSALRRKPKQLIIQ